MIPKIIHYCWFGRNPLPPLALKCIESWKKYLPDYEIKEWNEENFDINIIPYTKEAYVRRKYAFVSDYARFWILYNYGGIYFDTDVLVLRNMNEILSKGPYMGLENDATEDVGYVEGNNLGFEVNTGLGCAAEKGMHFYKIMLDKYQDLHFVFPSGAINTKTVVSYTSEEFIKLGANRINEIQLVDGIYIYPRFYFAPKLTNKGIPIIETYTYTAHLYAGTWVDTSMRFKMKISRLLEFIFPIKVVLYLRSFYRFLLRKNIYLL